MINRRYDNIESRFIEAAYVTLNKYGVPLTTENYVNYFQDTLVAILLNNNYERITRTDGARQNIKSCFLESNETFFDIIRSRLGNESLEQIMPSLYSEKPNRDLVAIEFNLYINCYVQGFLIPKISKEFFEKSDIKDEAKGVSAGIGEDEKYYSNAACKEAIKNNKPIDLKHDEQKVYGMQGVIDEGKVRKNQEDAFYIGVHPKNHDFKIMVVCDGMGGLEKGEHASNLAVREMKEWFESLDPKEYYQADNGKLNTLIANQINKINSDIVSKYPGSGTTLCCSIIKKDNIFMCNVGDSKGFIMRDGKLVYVTKTHNYVESVLNIPENFGRFHPSSNVITSYLGDSNASSYSGGVSYYGESVPLRSGSDYKVVLCSDGVCDCLTNNKIAEIAYTSDGDNLASNLVDAALNSKSSFQEELEQSFRQYGITGSGNFVKLVDFLRQNGMSTEYNKIINGGKDNTTAVSTGIRR